MATRRDRRTYCLVGDGELNEGSIWEAVALAGHLAPPGLCLIVDANGFQGLGPVSDVLSLEPLAGKFRAFGWAVDEVDGHDHSALERRLGGPRVRPTAIVARTVKGYGVPALEGQFMSHYRSFRPHERDLLFAGLDVAARGGVRDAFFRALAELGAADDRVWALTGDLGVGLFEPFEAAAPGRYLNVGIAEQTLVGVAAGLAYAGKVPFAYSIAPFVTSRPHDQVRVDVACAEANVKLVGVGAGVSYGTLGPTHHAIDDLALMRVLPGMTVLAPGDPADAERATHAACAHEGPVYLRLGKNGEPALLPEGAEFEIGRAIELRRGADVTIACTGTALREATAAADLLARDGVAATLLHFGTVKPFDAEALIAAAARTGAVVTVEEHSIVAGFGSAAAEALAEAGVGAILRRVGFPDTFAHAVGSRDYLVDHYGLSAAAVAHTAHGLLEGRRTCATT